MRILYVGAENPAVETILNGMDDSTLGGLPAFYYPFKMLLERGCTIDLLLYATEHKKVRNSRYFRKENLIQIHPIVPKVCVRRQREKRFEVAEETNETDDTRSFRTRKSNSGHSAAARV